MKKIIVMMAVVAFSALAFAEDAAPPTTGTTGETAAPADAGKTTTDTGKKTAKKSKHTHKAKKDKKAEDKAM